MYNLVLISKSPRRSQLLSQLGYQYKTTHIQVSEITHENLSPSETVMSLAQMKSQQYRIRTKQKAGTKDLLLTADTLVFLNKKPLGKPENKEMAYKYLKSLSNKAHEVLTGICLYAEDRGEEILAYEKTKVFFKELSDEMIWTYIESGEPMDKAGAYAIQGEGRQFVEKFEGSLNNVIGLPTDLFQKLLKDNNFEISGKE